MIPGATLFGCECARSLLGLAARCRWCPGAGRPWEGHWWVPARGLRPLLDRAANESRVISGRLRLIGGLARPASHRASRDVILSRRNMSLLHLQTFVPRYGVVGLGGGGVWGREREDTI